MHDSFLQVVLLESPDNLRGALGQEGLDLSVLVFQGAPSDGSFLCRLCGCNFLVILIVHLEPLRARSKPPSSHETRPLIHELPIIGTQSKLCRGL